MYRLEYINNSLFNTPALARGHSEAAWYEYRVKYQRKKPVFLSRLTFEVRNVMKGLEFKEEINQRLIDYGIISADKTKMTR